MQPFSKREPKGNESWLDLVVDSMKENEAPSRYFWWSAAAVIASVVGKKIYLNRFHYKLYPNIYVMLISARSGLRKGIPISVAAGLLNEVNCTRVVSGRNSIQGIIKELSTQRTLEGGTILSDAQGLLLSDEFSSFMVQDPQALTILTGLHNTHEHQNGWKNTLKGSPVEVLKNPCVSLLGASNEVHFENVVKQIDLEGGFLGRTFVVYEEKRQRINPLTEAPENLVPMNELAKRLHEVKRLEGEFKWTPRTKQIYDAWYYKIAQIEYEDRTGSMDRLGDQALKVAMLISLSKNDSLELDELSLLQAIEKTEACMGGAKRVSLGSGNSEMAKATAKVIRELVKAPDRTIGRRELLRKVWPDIDAIALDRVIETLTQSGGVEAFRGRGKEGVVYKMSEKASKQFTEFLSESMKEMN